MKVIDLNEAKANLEGYADECQQSPVIVTVGGIPKFELVPIHTDDPDFIDRLLEENESFRGVAEESRREADQGRVSTLAEVRKRLEASS
jgi:Antitoxin Phd_YefM, type II toxin-antitoxin system